MPLRAVAVCLRKPATGSFAAVMGVSLWGRTHFLLVDFVCLLQEEVEQRTMCIARYGHLMDTCLGA